MSITTASATARPTAAWTLGDVVQATGATVAQRGDAADFTRIATDTRTLLGGELFVALRGEHHDANRFAAEAAERGARGVLVASEPGTPLGDAVTVLEAPDGLRALQDLGAWHRRRHAPCVVGLTGSNGKTTTKEMLAAVLGASVGAAGVLKTQGNLNNLVGVPLTLLELCGHERYAVVEMGMNAPGEIWRLAEIADPDVGLITNVGPAHLEGLGSIEGVQRAKGELFARMRRDATAVANADDPLVAALADGFPGPVVRFGAGTGITAERVRIDDIGVPCFELRIRDTTAEVTLKIPGRHNVQNALAAAAVADSLGIGIEVVAAGLAVAESVGDRMRIERLPNGAVVLNDSYNANPASMAVALDSLARLPLGAAGRRIAVLGDMLELGSGSAEHHRALGRAAAAAGLTALFVYGDYASDSAAGATGGLPASAIHAAKSHAEIAAALRQMARAGDWILVKGSRGQRMEEVVRLLMEAV